MTIDDRLFQLLTGSPPPTPAIGGRWFPMQAAQGTPTPYGVFAPIASPALNTMDRQAGTRIWTYQITIIDTGFASATALRNAALNFLLAFAGVNDIQRVLEITRSARYLDTQRLYQIWADVSIIENLP